MPSTVFLYHISEFALHQFKICVPKLSYSCRYTVSDLHAHWLFEENEVHEDRRHLLTLEDIVSMIDGTHFFSMADMSQAARSLCALGECLDIDDHDMQEDMTNSTISKCCELVFRLKDDTRIHVHYDLDKMFSYVHREGNADTGTSTLPQAHIHASTSLYSPNWLYDAVSGPISFMWGWLHAKS